jgi:hypothetical protein
MLRMGHERERRRELVLRPDDTTVPPDLVVAQALSEGLHTVVLVEGASDRVALLTLARRYDRDLAAEGVAVVAMGGATSVGRYWSALGPRGAGLRLAGMCDVAEARHFSHALRRSGHEVVAASGDLERHGVFVCTVDLEDELVRALGMAAVEEAVDAAGELGSLRTFQQQPAQRGRSAQAQVRRFLGTRSGRKIQYAALLAERLDLARVPAPLERLLAHIA